MHPYRPADLLLQWTGTTVGPTRYDPDDPPARRGEPQGDDVQGEARLTAFGLNQVCLMILDGAGIRDIAKAAGVGKSLALRWMHRPEHRDAVLSARELTGWHWDEEAEWELKGAETADDIQRAKALAAHYRWRAGKLNQTVYGERVRAELSGPNGGPVRIEDGRRPIIDLIAEVPVDEDRTEDGET